LQLGPDNKIYVANYIHDYLSVINNPDFLGLSCNYQHDAILLSPGSSNLGLPTFIQSYFFTTSIVYENTCFGDTTNFYLATTPDTVVWNFGDPTSGANNTSTLLAPSHIFTKSGTYTVSATATLGTETTIETQEITIYKTPSATKPSNLTVCDSNNDGFFNFNLKNLDATILNGQNPDDFSVDYYANSTDYDNNTPITDYTNYVNAVAYHEQTIIVSVKNKNNNSCEATTNFTIQVFDSPTPALSTAIPNLSDCDNTSVGIDLDGKITFNLTDRETAILNGQSNSDFLITYYEDDNLTQLINNPTSYTNNTATQRIYAKVENKLNTTCFAKTSFLIEVFELPTINNTVSLKQCDNADINGFSSINLNEAKAKIVSNPENYTITFFEEKAFAESNTNVISNPTTYTNQTVSNDVVWARVENSNGCYRVSEINLIVSTTQIPASFLKTIYNCDDGTDTTDGIATFNFSSVTQEVKDLFPANQQLIVNYYRNEADALAEINEIADISNYQNTNSPNQQNIYIRVDSELDNDCLGLGHHITLNVETVPVANAVSVNPECDNDRDGVFSFDTSNIQSTIIGNQTNIAVRYFDENNNPLSSPLPNPFITDSQTIKARIVNTTSKDPNGQCYNETTIDFIVNSVPIANTVSPQEQCDDDFDGIADFDTSNIESIILGTQTGMVVKYFDENNNPLPSPLPNPFMTISQRITVRVENPEYAVCYDETTFDFTVREKPDFELEEETIICITNNTSLDITIQNPAGSYFYEWKNENGDVISNNSTANVSKGGIYSVKAISMLGCESEIKNIEVRESSISNITIDNLEIIDDSENNSIRINTQNIGLGNYEFSLIDFDSNIIYDYQETPFFDNLEGGIYTIFIKDINGCGTQSFETSIISYPKFFTPNNDGVNDYWHIKGIGQSFYKDGKVQIFNRYGKLVKILSFKDIGWNGFYNGKKLPSNDYWFYAELTDPKGNIIIRKGYFSLLRK
jgi:gliding motility-associated-like protein